MVSLYDGGVYLVNGTEIIPEAEGAKVKALTGIEAVSYTHLGCPLRPFWDIRAMFLKMEPQ